MKKNKIYKDWLLNDLGAVEFYTKLGNYFITFEKIIYVNDDTKIPNLFKKLPSDFNFPISATFSVFGIDHIF